MALYEEAPTITESPDFKLAHESEKIEIKRKTRRSTAEQGSPSLCDLCVNSVVFRRENDINKMVFCRAISEYVPSDVEQCNSFVDMKEMPLYRMKEMALEINSDAVRKVGFLRENE